MNIDELLKVLSEFGQPLETASEAPRTDDDEQIVAIPWPTRIDEDGPTTDTYRLDPDVLPPGLRVGDFVGDRPAPDDRFDDDGEWGVHACAWYRSLTRHGTASGIFIRQDCWLDRARRLAPWLYPSGTPLSPGRIEQLIRTAFIWLFLHEQFHHKIEAFAIRLLVSDRRPVYARYWTAVYGPAFGTDAQLEEALANADMYRRLSESKYAAVLGPIGVAGLRAYLDFRLPRALPGYRRAVEFLTDDKFDAGEALLQARIHEANPTPAPGHERWHVATHMTRSILPITSYVWAIVPAASTPVVIGRSRRPSRGSALTVDYLSVSTREVERVLASQGFARNADRGKGSHVVWDREGWPPIVVPTQGDLTPGVLHNIARLAGFVNGRHLAEAARRRR